LDILCPCPDTWWEAAFKHVELVYLTEEISRQHRIQAVTLGITGCFKPDLQGESGAQRSRVEIFGKFAFWSEKKHQ
jgi:hypothetical protein